MTETDLIEILTALDKEYGDLMLLSDGANDWTPCNLIDALRNADEPDNAEYVQGCHEDGRITITRRNDDGYLGSIPTYVQKWTSGSLAEGEVIAILTSKQETDAN